MHQSERSKKRPAPSVHLDFPYYRGKHSEHPPGPGGSAGGGQALRRGGGGRLLGGGVKTPRFWPPRGGGGGVPPPGGHFPLPKIRPQPEMRTGKKPTKLYSTKCRPKTAFLPPPGGGVTPGGSQWGSAPPARTPPGGAPHSVLRVPPREGGVRTPPPEGVRDPPPGVPGADRGWSTRSGVPGGGTRPDRHLAAQ